MSQNSGHLSDEEIRQCANTGPGDSPHLTEAHLSECQDCLERLLRWQGAQLKHLETVGMRHEPYPDCPAEEIVREVAAEVAPAHIARRTLQHVAQCDHCGPLLKSYREAFSEELSPEMAAMVEKTPSATAKAQQKLAREIARSINVHKSDDEPTKWEKTRAWFATTAGRVTAGATAAAMVVFGFVEGPVLYGRWQLSKADELIATTSSLIGTTELRVPGQKGKPDVIVVKGADAGIDWASKPAQLSEAELLVKRFCPARPDAKCLELRGRISRLEGQQDSAKNAAAEFERAVALHTRDPRLRIELAISYFDQHKLEKRPNLSSTIDLLNQALLDPALRNEDKQVATYDLAVSYEKSELWDLAVSTWDAYLGLDPSGPWRLEAERRLKKARDNIPAKRPLSYREPGYFLQHFSDRGVLQGLEQYLEIAMREWLPRVIEDPAGDAARASDKLADLLVERHADPWLKDFLSSTRQEALPAVKALNAAVSDNMNDRHQLALNESVSAAQTFRKQENLPGELRARFEEVYALQRSLRSSECLSRSDTLERLLADSRYGWLRIQVKLEKAACSDLVSDKTRDDPLDASRKLNDEFHYPELGLRIVGFDAAIEKNRRNYNAAWSKAISGLQTYWQGTYSWERLYQFYSVMWQCAKRNHSPYAAQALILQGIRIFEENAPTDQNLRAVLYLRLANNLREQNENALAAKETAKALSLLTASQDGTAKEYALSTQIEFAEVELARGQPRLALAAIEPVRELLATGNVLVKADFYETLARTYWKLSRLDDAVSAYQSAIEIIENSVLLIPEESRFHWLATARGVYAGLTQVLLMQAKNQKALEVWEQFKLLAFANRSRDLAKREAVKFSTAVFRLPEPHLIYASFEDHLQVWILKDGAVGTKSVAVSRADLGRLIGDLADACKTPNTGPEVLDGLERELYSYLVQPVAAELAPGQTLAVELDQPGNEFPPFKVESLKGAQDHYFSDDYTIIYSPGILVEERLRDPLPFLKQKPVLFVAGSGYLPGNEHEQSAVTHVFPETLVLAGEQATNAKIKKALVNRAAFIYSGHARDGAAGMVLAVNSSTSLNSQDFHPETLSHLQLVVLSACASGTAENGLMDANNLVHAFLAGGVPNVVASSWNVDSRTTALFMQSFYEGLGRGKSAARSLDDARRAVRAVKPHPYYWAAFSLTGRAG